jgi:cell division septation protein DedD
MSDRETEITLGAGRLLGLFFGLAVVCAIFFVAGYRLGKRSPGTGGPLTDVPAVPGSAAVKPAATQGALVIKPNCANTPEGCGQASPEGTPADASANSGTPGTTPGDTTQAAAPSAATPPTPEPVRSDNSTGYIVQVAAVSKQQDAEALVAALRRKQYQVFIATSAADNLFHVQAGPFGDSKDAEAIRSRLIADGYNPIVKR